jgi:hypothetical protein
MRSRLQLNVRPHGLYQVGAGYGSIDSKLHRPVGCVQHEPVGVNRRPLVIDPWPLPANGHECTRLVHGLYAPTFRCLLARRDRLPEAGPSGLLPGLYDIVPLLCALYWPSGPRKGAPLHFAAHHVQRCGGLVGAQHGHITHRPVGFAGQQGATGYAFVAHLAPIVPRAATGHGPHQGRQTCPIDSDQSAGCARGAQ